MLLDENLTKASEAESSAREDSFANGQDQAVLLDQVREFQPEDKIAEADRQIYADQNFNYIPPQQRTTPRVTQKSKDEVLLRAREIAEQKKKATQPKEAKAKNNSAASKSHTEEQTKTLTTAKAKAAKAKKAKAKKSDATTETEEKNGLTKKVLPDTAKLAYDATHGDPRRVVGDLADQYLHWGAILGFALWAVWMVLSVVLLIPFIFPGLIAAIFLNGLLISPKTVYRLSKWILELVGVGEALSFVDTFGLAKVDIRLTQWQKLTIILYDLLVFIGLIAILTFILSIGKYICDQSGLGNSGLAQTVAPVVTKVIDWWSGNDYATTVSGMCNALNSIGK